MRPPPMLRRSPHLSPPALVNNTTDKISPPPQPRRSRRFSSPALVDDTIHETSPPTQPRGSRRLSPCALVDDNIYEILLRLPPEDPASLVRAGAVSKDWQRVLSDAAFTRFYGAFHRAPPMLGFLHNSFHDTYCVSKFVPTGSSFCLPGCRDRRDWYVVDSRHGLILYCTPEEKEDFVVSNPMTNTEWNIPANPTRYSPLLVNEDDDLSLTWNAAVLCSRKCCNHLNCSAGPFVVVFVGSNDENDITFATVYSSETRRWRKPIYVKQPETIREFAHRVLLGDNLYFPCESETEIMEYNMGEHKLRVIDRPAHRGEKLVLMATDGCMLLFAGVWESKLHLWSMKVGAVEWALRIVVELKPLLPRRTNLDVSVSVVGAVEDAGVIFLRTNAGLFEIDLNSAQSKKVYGTSFGKIIPYTSFYTGGAYTKKI